MFVLIWTTLLFTVRDTGASLEGTPFCEKGFCITLSEEEITAEAGLCVVIPCSFTTSYYFRPQHVVWYKCEPSKTKCTDSDIIFNTNKNNNKTQSGFRGRVSLLEPDVSRRNCSIMVNDITESDSGSYQLRVNGLLNERTDGFRFSPRTTVSVKDLTQKPTVMIPPLTEGQQSTLSCTAPGLCSGSDPEITWTWRGAGEKDSHIPGNITDFRTENLTAVTWRHSSTLTFNSSAEHHGTNISCKVSFTNNITTEETVTLNVAYVRKLKSREYKCEGG
ncbi:myeloid cell surface antigen CD33 [Etheostoma spectabile]|uniref:myeloid cell surface antigen CD33 n=1 Tax=Etheostoma spectabile TaxID=54343 RepID=UPI0013AF5414|nr:myeloid cell surface antigen CD33-like [Etheostoma spectabile]